MHRLEVRPGSPAERAIRDALAAFGPQGITEHTLREMMLAGALPESLPALRTLLYYRLVDFSRIEQHDPHCDTNRLEQPRHCSLLHCMAVAGTESGHGHSSLAERFALLKEAGIDLDVPCANGETPLMWAARYHRPAAARALLAAGADIFACENRGYTPLHLAAEAGHAEMVALLCEASQSPNLLTANTLKWAPLHVAAAKGQCAVISALHRCDANMDLQAADCASPLLVAVRSRHPHTIASLIEHGASVDFPQGADRHTALHCAARRGLAKEARALLKAGAKANAKTRSGYRPLHFIALYTGHIEQQLEIVQALLDGGAKIDAAAHNQKRPVDLAAEKGNAHIYDVLVDRGASTPPKLNTATYDP